MNKLSSAIIVHNRCFKRWVSTYGIKKCYVIPHGIIEEEDHSEKLNSKIEESHCRNILFFGVLSPRKGLEYLLQAFSKVFKKKNDIRLIIAGDEPPYYRGYKERLINMACSLGIKDKVLFTGFVKDDQIDALFRQADIVVFPYPFSISASGPLSIAIQHGKPIIATATEFFVEELKDGQTALLVSPRNFENLASAMERLIANDKLKRKLTKNIKSIAKEKSWRKIAQLTFELYLKILNQS